MGGPGSGNRWRSGSKSETDDYHVLDVRHLAREGALLPGYASSWRWTRNGEVKASIQIHAEHGHLTLIDYIRGDATEWKDKRYSVRILRTRCNFGGTRHWLMCPAVGCGRRVAILYGGSIFACRHCHQLAYASAREDPQARAIRRIYRIRARLGWKLGILNRRGDKPKWMRWGTFERLVAQHDKLAAQSIQRLMRKLK